MATAIVTEFTDSGVVAGQHRVEMAKVPWVVDPQVVSFTTSTATTNAFNSGTTYVRIQADAKAHFVFGTAPTADANDPWVVANVPEYFSVGLNSGLKVAFYDGTS